MPVLGSNSNVDKEEIKEGEKILKSIIGGQVVRNRPFYKKMAINGIRNTPKAWHTINSRIRKELKSGQLHPNDVEKRIDELILEISGQNVLIGEKDSVEERGNKYKYKIRNEKKVSIQIPYQASGVGGTVRGGVALGQFGAFLGSLQEGTTQWKATELFFIDGGISIKATGQVALYENMNKVVFGDRGAGYSIITIITNNGENIIFRASNPKAIATKSIIEDNIVPKISQDTQTNKTPIQTTNTADELLKYAELYEKGLLTKDEFDMKKAELLGNPRVDEIETQIQDGDYSLKQDFIEENDFINEDKPKFCANCGTAIDTDSNFCTNCGNKLK